MNRKLTQDDRDRIRRMLDTATHEEIAEEFGVSTRTIDREAAYWEARTVTVTFKAEGGRLELASVRVGSEVGPVDVDGIAEEAARAVSGLDLSGAVMTEAELSSIMEEAERVARQFDVPPYVGRAC